MNMTINPTDWPCEFHGSDAGEPCTDLGGGRCRMWWFDYCDGDTQQGETLFYDHSLGARRRRVGPADGDLTSREQFERGVRRRADALRIDREAKRLLRAEEAEEASADMPTFDAGTLAEMQRRDTKIEWLVPGLIVRGGFPLVVSQRKAGKTTLLLNTARSLLRGEDWLGRFPVAERVDRLAFLNFEVPPEQFTEWAMRMGLPSSRFVVVNLRDSRNPFAHPPDRERLTEYLREKRVEALMVDPFADTFTGDNVNDPQQVRNFLTGLRRWATNEVGAHTTFLSAHAGWGDDARARSSSALEDVPDAIFTLTRDRGGRVRKFAAPHVRGEEVPKTRLDFDPKTLRLTLATIEAEVTDEAEGLLNNVLRPVAVGIMQAFETAPAKGLSLNRMVAATGVKRETVATARDALIGAGYLSHQTPHQRLKPWDGDSP